MVEKTGNETMKDMPKSVQKWYRLWVGAFPESRHPRDLERFYMFVSILLFRTRKERSRYWLEENLREDCQKLSENDIEWYCDLYEHLRDFSKVWDSNQSRLLAMDNF